MVVGNRHDHLRQPFTVDPGRSRGGVREHIYARHISVGDDPSPAHDVPVGVGVFHLSTGFHRWLNLASPTEGFICHATYRWPMPAQRESRHPRKLLEISAKTGF